MTCGCECVCVYCVYAPGRGVVPQQRVQRVQVGHQGQGAPAARRAARAARARQRRAQHRARVLAEVLAEYAGQLCGGNVLYIIYKI